jgi:hypothetical protein
LADVDGCGDVYLQHLVRSFGSGVLPVLAKPWFALLIALMASLHIS